MIIAGVPKAGTTSLFRYLADHPDVCAANVKEIRFFTRHHGRIDAARLSEYAQYFSQAQGQRYRLEASPGYLLRAADIAGEMRSQLPRETKLIFLLREPVSRIVSLFSAKQSKVGSIRADMSFDEFVEVALGHGDLRAIHDDEGVASRMANRVHEGVYAASLRRFLEVWPREQVFVDFFESLNADPKGFVGRVCGFLELDPAIYADYTFTVENKTQAPRLKGLHRAVHGLNRTFEKQLNGMPAARKMARQIYNSLATSGDKAAPLISEGARQRLREFYRLPNSELRTLCTDVLALDVPEWLAAAK